MKASVLPSIREFHVSSQNAGLPNTTSNTPASFMLHARVNSRTKADKRHHGESVLAYRWNKAM